MEQFAVECGLRGPLRFLVEHLETGHTDRIDVYEPFVLIGRAKECHLRLPHPDVAFRHVYLQVIKGRLYGFDFESPHGNSWGSGLGREGQLTTASRLQVGPYLVRLSRAPKFTASLDAPDVAVELENEPLEDLRLLFENAAGRGSGDPMRPLRRHITVLGRSGRCHLRLADPSVSKAHCSIVRTEGGFWVVDLLGRDGTSVNERRIRFAPLLSGECVHAGRFRMRIRDLAHAEAEVVHRDAPLINVPDAPTDESDDRPRMHPTPPQARMAKAAEAVFSLIHARRSLPKTVQPSLPAANDPTQGLSESLLLAMMEQFAHLQQQLLDHTQQQMSMLTEMFAALHKAQNDAVMEQLSRINAITAELVRLRGEQVVPPSASVLPEAATAASGALTSCALQTPGDADSVATAPDVADERIELAESQDAQPPHAPLDEAHTGAAAEGGVAPDQAAQPATRVAAPRQPLEPRRRRTAADDAPGTAAVHEWLTQRINDLERERSSRWKRLLQLVAGAPPEGTDL